MRGFYRAVAKTVDGEHVWVGMPCDDANEARSAAWHLAGQLARRTRKPAQAWVLSRDARLLGVVPVVPEEDRGEAQRTEAE